VVSTKRYNDIADLMGRTSTANGTVKSDVCWILLLLSLSTLIRGDICCGRGWIVGKT